MFKNAPTDGIIILLIGLCDRTSVSRPAKKDGSEKQSGRWINRLFHVTDGYAQQILRRILAQFWLQKVCICNRIIFIQAVNRCSQQVESEFFLRQSQEKEIVSYYSACARKIETPSSDCRFFGRFYWNGCERLMIMNSAVDEASERSQHQV